MFKRYYHRYLKEFTDFLVPSGQRVLRLNNPAIDLNQVDQAFDYIVATDILGSLDDVDHFLCCVAKILSDNGRLIIIQYSTLWEPILKLATWLGFRKPPEIKQNWLSPLDLKNFIRLAGLEPVKSGTKLIWPMYLPFISSLLNRWLANIFPFSRLGLVHYLVARKTAPRQKSNNPSLSIIVPARNEAGTIEKIAKELPNLDIYTELIFIEGNSTDKTYEEIERVAKKYQKTRKIIYSQQDGRGKGNAVRKGFDLATGDILAIYDADMTVPPQDITKFYRALVENRGDFINGSRLVYPMEKESMRLLNFFGNKFFSLVFSWILGQPIKDTLCGTKVLWKKDYDEIKRNRSFFGEFDPFGDFDLLFGAAKLNLKIIDLPVRYKERVYGSTNISRFSHGWLLLKMTLFAAKKIKFR